MSATDFDLILDRLTDFLKCGSQRYTWWYHKLEGDPSPLLDIEGASNNGYSMGFDSSKAISEAHS